MNIRKNITAFKTRPVVQVSLRALRFPSGPVQGNRCGPSPSQACGELLI